MVSALTAARELECPTFFASYDAWFNASAAAQQLKHLQSFLRCAGVRTSTKARDQQQLLRLIRPGECQQSTRLVLERVVSPVSLPPTPRRGAPFPCVVDCAPVATRSRDSLRLGMARQRREGVTR